MAGIRNSHKTAISAPSCRSPGEFFPGLPRSFAPVANIHPAATLPLQTPLPRPETKEPPSRSSEKLNTIWVADNPKLFEREGQGRTAGRVALRWKPRTIHN